jgi:hypothetical protein
MTTVSCVAKLSKHWLQSKTADVLFHATPTCEVIATRRAARFRRRRAWASRDSSSRCSSRCSGCSATQRSGNRASRAAVSPGAIAAIRRSTSVNYGHTSTQFRRALPEALRASLRAFDPGGQRVNGRAQATPILQSIAELEYKPPLPCPRPHATGPREVKPFRLWASWTRACGPGDAPRSRKWSCGEKAARGALARSGGRWEAAREWPPNAAACTTKWRLALPPCLATGKHPSKLEAKP